MDDILVKITASDLVYPPNTKVLGAIVDETPDRTIPVVFLSGILQQLNADCGGKLFPVSKGGKSLKEVVNITMEIAARIAASQSYLRKLCRTTYASRNKTLAWLKSKCTKCGSGTGKASGLQVPQYPMDGEVEDDEDLEDDGGPNAEDAVDGGGSKCDALMAKFPECLSAMQQGESEAVLNSFIEVLSSPGVQDDLSSKTKALLHLQGKHGLTSLQGQAVFDFLQSTARVALGSAVISISDSEMEDGELNLLKCRGLETGMRASNIIHILYMDMWT